MSTSTAPGARDLADFARQAIEFGLLAPAAVVAWADGVIAAADSPPPWVIELSLGPDDAHEMIVRLRTVPGTPTDALARYLLLALVRREWCRGGLTIGQVRGIGWRLHSAGAIPTPDGKADWGVVLECEADDFDESWRSEQELRASIDKKLAQYKQYEGLLPTWA